MQPRAHADRRACACTQVTDVEWSEKKIWHRYRTNMVSGPPCCCILGYGAEMSVEEIGPNKTRLIDRAYQDQVVLAAPLPPVPLLLPVLERRRQQLPGQGRRRSREEVGGPGEPGGALVSAGG